MKLSGLLASAVAPLVCVTPAHADQWAVSKIKYKNEGAYWSFFTFAALDRAGKTRECNSKNQNGEGLENGDSITLRLDNSDDSTNTNWQWQNCLRENGAEVWGIVYIDHAGVALNKTLKRKSCRKDKARYFYHPHGGVLVVNTKGTTENNNHCRIEHNGGVRWDQSVHGSNIYQSD